MILFLSCFYVTYAQDDSSEEKPDVPLIRQINKVNDDGTYTYGYEAADGSFKIETRDVLGNVKGMFGFIDESGNLKRVSYTTNNETGFRNSIVHPPVSTTVRPSELGRRPVLILKNTPNLQMSTKGPVIQHIPKKSQKEEEELTSTEYINTRNLSFEKNNVTEETTDTSSKIQSSNLLRKVLVSKRPIEDKGIKSKGGNHLRRQLHRELDLRGQMAHIYAGGETRFSSGIPPHLSALMSELRPIQVVRTDPPDTTSYQPLDVDSASQELNEVSTTTTELPYGTRKLVPPTTPGYIHPRYRRPIPVPASEETQYLQEVPPQYRPQNVPLYPQGLSTTALVSPVQPVPSQIPVGIPNPNYQTQPQYYDQPSLTIPPTLRDELMAIVYHYLQVRLGQLAQNPYYSRYPYSPHFVNPLFAPTYPYANPNYSPLPYANPYLPLPPYYPHFTTPNGGFPVSTQTPYSGPNVQFSRPEQQQHQQQHQQQQPYRRLAPPRSHIARATADDADLLQMLLTSPTRVPIHQLNYAPTTERLINSRTGQAVRNLQIITDIPESRPVSTDSPEK